MSSRQLKRVCPGEDSNGLGTPAVSIPEELAELSATVAESTSVVDGKEALPTLSISMVDNKALREDAWETIRGVVCPMFNGCGTSEGSGAEHVLPEMGEHASKLTGDQRSDGLLMLWPPSCGLSRVPFSSSSASLLLLTL